VANAQSVIAPSLGSLAAGLRPRLRTFVARQALPPTRARRALLIVLAAVGASLVAIEATTRWAGLQDEGAYWRAGARLLSGQPLYDPAATVVTPWAYLYPPPLAQALAPVTAVLPEAAFSALWTLLLLGCLLYLARGRLLVALAMVAFVPVAVELGYRNVHLLLAALLVLGLRGRPALLAVGAAIKVGPGLGLLYLALRGRWREASTGLVAGFAILFISLVIGPAAWGQFLAVVASTAAIAQTTPLPIGYPARLAIAVLLTIVASRLPEQYGEATLVVAVVLANPSLWATALSMLVATIPLWETAPKRKHAMPTAAA
jgi:hypothetical protein